MNGPGGSGWAGGACSLDGGRRSERCAVSSASQHKDHATGDAERPREPPATLDPRVAIGCSVSGTCIRPYPCLRAPRGPPNAAAYDAGAWASRPRSFLLLACVRDDEPEAAPMGSEFGATLGCRMSERMHGMLPHVSVGVGRSELSRRPEAKRLGTPRRWVRPDPSRIFMTPGRAAGGDW